jgi:hypothetical protein
MVNSILYALLLHRKILFPKYKADEYSQYKQILQNATITLLFVPLTAF